ncbi:PAS domain S-box-containing protein [Filimonas zeae]|nr:PAS domain-containing protein [Filimonas zeae]MDR6340313.1 PAS domain S-box-containing protein [Filimonas zeae]
MLPDGTTMQLAVTRDVTGQKGAEASAIESEFRFHTLAEEAPLWIWLTDKAGKVKYANKAMLAWLGFQQHTAISREVWSTFVHVADQHLLAKIVQQAYENKAAYNIECRVRSCHTQEYEWFAFTTVPRHINGLFDGFVGTASNIDMQKRSVEALEFRVQQRTRELHEANAAHGGSIEAEGVPGQGALFKVILPA